MHSQPGLLFYRGKRVFLTGHTGFKGSWLSLALRRAGAEVTGFALPPKGPEALFTIAGLEKDVNSIYGDVRDFDALQAAFRAARPEIVLHLAAQPIVRESYRDPLGTYSANVMGTVHLLECVRRDGGVRSFLNVTTDKVYQNRGDGRAFREDDPLDGFDPYSNSKSCSELVTHSYRSSFFRGGPTAVSTARAGNVIGGGDFAPDRILPDCVRAVRDGRPVRVRNPDSVRPYQHLLDPLAAYLLIARRQYEDPGCAGCYNVGPEIGGCVSTRTLVELFCRKWGPGAAWEQAGEDGPHEDAVLTLDCEKIRAGLGWRPRMRLEQAVEEVVGWTRVWLSGGSVRTYMEELIDTFFD